MNIQLKELHLINSGGDSNLGPLLSVKEVRLMQIFVVYFTF